ncbi:hypothetical protein O6P37_21290 [Mycobacterium sp. CPCC 205372]|uniref:Uncharacterized protein n=2 Tax=Mycobacterium hippophais TaxID=3016340 RepID=A0ABT4PY10_9MYCO|nr:hypothetical protein [Mycobacterium hippophais]
MPSLRPLMCAGVVVGGLVVAGPAAGVAIADPGLSDDAGNRDSSLSGKRDADRKPGLRLGSRNDDGSGSQRKRRSFGISLDRDGDRKNEKPDGYGAREPGRIDIRVPGGRRNLPIPQLRVSVGADSERKPDTCSGSNCVGLRVAGVSAEVSLFSAQPEPEPEPPGPTFRGGPADVDPVADAGSGAGEPGRFSAGAPGVLEVPMIVPPPPPPVPASVVGMAPLPAVVPGAPAGTAPSPGLFGIQAALPSSASGGPMIVPPGFNAPALPGSNLASGAAMRSGLPSATRPAGPGARWLGAMPGLFGLFLVTLCGGFIGYRQANAVRYVRAGGADRFLG